jgi:hypothetical protein
MGSCQQVGVEARTLCVGVSVLSTLRLYPLKVENNRIGGRTEQAQPHSLLPCGLRMRQRVNSGGGKHANEDREQALTARDLCNQDVPCDSAPAKCLLAAADGVVVVEGIAAGELAAAQAGGEPVHPLRR